MKITEKGLAEKVMFAIYIDSQKEVEDYFRDYLKHIEFLGEKKDIKLQDKVCLRYTIYQVNKSKEIIEGNELSLRM